MNRREMLKTVMGGSVGVVLTGEVVANDKIARHASLPIAQYQREIELDSWYKRTTKDPVRRKAITCQRVVRVLTNADEIMGGEWKLVTDMGKEDAIGRKITYLRRTGRAWVKKEDAEHLLHGTTLTPIKVWGEVEMSEMMVLSIGGFAHQGCFTKTRTVGMTDKTMWEERKWVWDHRHVVSMGKNGETQEHEFNFYREDCQPERVGDVQELHYKVVYEGYCGVGRAERVYTLCGPVDGGKWQTEWMDKEEALMVNILNKADVYSKGWRAT